MTRIDQHNGADNGDALRDYTPSFSCSGEHDEDDEKGDYLGHGPHDIISVKGTNVLETKAPTLSIGETHESTSDFPMATIPASFDESSNSSLNDSLNSHEIVIDDLEIGLTAERGCTDALSSFAIASPPMEVSPQKEKRNIEQYCDKGEVIHSTNKSVCFTNESASNHSENSGGSNLDSDNNHVLSKSSKRFRIFSSFGKDGLRNSDLSGADAENQYLTEKSSVSVTRNFNYLRRYADGDYVLISNHNLDDILQLVNMYGFANWDTNALNSEERRGPYIYLLAQVKSVHYEEDAQYYTVMRINDGVYQRADVDTMEPLTHQYNIDAAKRAAIKQTTRSSKHSSIHVENRHGRVLRAGFSHFIKSISSYLKSVSKKGKKQLAFFLNGKNPYNFTCRISGVNILVICSIWFLYIDQLRLAFAPHSADFTFAVVSFVVWIVLVVELGCEVFIRPDGYFSLIRSDKAFLPSTVRYITNFHAVSEFIALVFFVPEFSCIFASEPCGYPRFMSLESACLMSLYGPSRLYAFYGKAFLCLLRLRLFGLIRHWENMWVNNTLVRVKGSDGTWTVERGKGLFIPQGCLHAGHENIIALQDSTILRTNPTLTERRKIESYTEDHHLTNASRIGTALLSTNAKRALILIVLIGLLPLFSVLVEDAGGTNQEPWTSVELLQNDNIATSITNEESCLYLRDSVVNFIAANAFDEYFDGSKGLHLVGLKILPVRCDFQVNLTQGIFWDTLCGYEIETECSKNYFTIDECITFCRLWMDYNQMGLLTYYSHHYNVRPSLILNSTSGSVGNLSFTNNTTTETYFYVNALYNEQLDVKRTILSLLYLQIGITAFVLIGLSVLRYDAGRLVLGPLRRMLKIVAFYATNPLAPPAKNITSLKPECDDSDTLGKFETEQLIHTITKITDLLRKCWGVAGAGIISSNLAIQEGGLTTCFNPTVPGLAVYAIFAFVAIDNFKSYLHTLQDDIMILINDIAAILHEEVYRWGYEDRGQCNKNLGNAFLMVYKIGAVSEVLEKREKAEDVIFSRHSSPSIRQRFTSGRHPSSAQHSTTSSNQSSIVRNEKFSQSHVDNLDLSSLPGMCTFTDRALLGLLKTFAGIHRDKTILNWCDDFRLGAGVRAASINLIFGMDAGWAVEGAVGSSFKIDATYLSPHVNMASRMMSATKQYGVRFLLSQSVERLLSVNAQGTLRHVDTVTVKGSSVQQKIFTYDAKVRSDFFLYGKTANQADLDSERYSPTIWSTDPDLLAMRNHISDEFLDTFNRGRDEYLAGHWSEAIKLLNKADKLMFQRVIDEGYLENFSSSFISNNISLSDLLAHDDGHGNDFDERLMLGDGPSQRLIDYMKAHAGEAPENWEGYRPLASK